MRNNEVYGDMTAWIAAHAGDNESDLMRLKRNLRLAREEELPASASCCACGTRKT